MVKRRKPKRRNKKIRPTHREFQFKDGDFQEYGTVTKVLGDNRFECNCLDSKPRICKLRMRIKERIVPGMYVLVSIREDNDDKGDIIYVYSSDHVKILRKNGEINVEHIESEEELIEFEEEEQSEEDVDFNEI